MNINPDESKPFAGEEIEAGDIFPGCSNGFLNGDLSPVHLEEEVYDVLLAPTKALYVAMFHAQ